MQNFKPLQNFKNFIVYINHRDTYYMLDDVNKRIKLKVSGKLE